MHASAHEQAYVRVLMCVNVRVCVCQGVGACSASAVSSHVNRDLVFDLQNSAKTVTRGLQKNK